MKQHAKRITGYFCQELHKGGPPTKPWNPNLFADPNSGYQNPAAFLPKALPNAHERVLQTHFCTVAQWSARPFTRYYPSPASRCRRSLGQLLHRRLSDAVSCPSNSEQTQRFAAARTHAQQPKLKLCMTTSHVNRTRQGYAAHGDSFTHCPLAQHVRAHRAAAQTSNAPGAWQR